MHPYSSTLEKILTSAEAKIKAMDKAEMNYKPSEKKWSKKEILGHLIDSAYNNHQRFLRAEKKGDLIFEGYDQEEWVRKNKYQNRELGEVLSFWIQVNKHIMELVNGLSEATLNKETLNHNFYKVSMNPVSEGEPSSLSYLIWDYINHLEHHLAQIIPDYKKFTSEFVI